jgi:MFS family permease
MTSTAAPSPDKASVFQLFSRPVLPATLMLGGGVTLYAVETYIMATVAPSIVRDVGGLSLLFWVTTLYVAAAVLGSIFVAMRPRGTGLRTVYVAGAVMFALGSLVCGLAPSMPVVLVGRTVQGFGAGVLAALAYAFIRFAYPEALWRKASTLYAAIWGVSTLLGPSLGGVFSDGSDWRHAFLLIVPVSALMAVLGPLLLPKADDDRGAGKVPMPQIGLLLAAVLLVSLAGTIEATQAKALLIALSIAAVIAMLAIEKRSDNRLLPSGAVTLVNPLARVYLIVFLLMLVLTSDIYIPYFLQTLHNITPLESGYLTALVALGWTIAAFISSTLSGRRASPARVVGCVLENHAAATLALFLARDNQAGALSVLTPAVIGMFLMGFGVGMAWAHLTTKILHIVENAEQDKASAAITTVQSLGSAFGAALAGVIVNSTGLVSPGGISGSVSAAHWLYVLMALPGLLTIAISLSIRATGDRTEQQAAAL